MASKSSNAANLSSASTEASRPRSAAIRVLMVEDNPGDALLTRTMLAGSTDHDFQLDVVPNLEEAKSRLRERQFHAVLLDLTLPDSVGADSIFELQRQSPELPIVVLTGVIDESLAMELVEAGAQDYLVKGRAQGAEIGRAIRLGIRRKEAETALRRQAQHDPLTGLANRSLFEGRLQRAVSRAQRHASQLAVLYLDLDRFKRINDTLGHDAGDALLVQVAQRLVGCVRDTDTVARLGGDEFAIILENNAGGFDPCLVAEKIIKEIGRPFVIGETEVSTSTSVGISVFPEGSSDPNSLLKDADTAMYAAKRAGRNRYHLVAPNPPARQPVSASSDPASCLSQALENGEFELHYQPQFDLASGGITGVEGLMRWRRGGGELIAPGEFIPLAEKSGAIEALGEWALYEVCEQYQRWRSEGFDPNRVAVNVSARQLESGDFLSVVDRVLHDTRMNPKALELELTETTLMSNPGATGELMKQLRTRGISISVDDFGTGYCSLSYLRRLTVDKLKIDRSFISEMSDHVCAAIVRAIVSMARALGLRVVAEGIERDSQLSAMRGFNVDAVQGFLLARPLPAPTMPFVAAAAFSPVLKVAS